MDLYTNKGKISAILDKTHATVVPAFSDTPVTTSLVIPFFLWECLKVGMEVVYTQFPDNSGVILGRMDGEWNHKIWQDPEGSCAVRAMTGDVEVVEGDEIITAGDVNVNAGNVNIPGGDMTTGAVPSYNSHTHTCPDGTTSGPQ